MFWGKVIMNNPRCSSQLPLRIDSWELISLKCSELSFYYSTVLRLSICEYINKNKVQTHTFIRAFFLSLFDN